jgi:predicted nucleic acid-binding protein
MIIDTMVFAYALLHVEGKYEQALNALDSTTQIVVPDSLFAELGNVVWQWIKFQNLPLQTGLNALQDAEAMVDMTIISSQIRDLALELAVSNDHPFYDTLFVAAALQTNTEVITFDRRLANKFPDYVILLT